MIYTTVSSETKSGEMQVKEEKVIHINIQTAQKPDQNGRPHIVFGIHIIKCSEAANYGCFWEKNARMRL